MNAYQRLLQYQELRRLGKEPGFYTEVRSAWGQSFLPLVLHPIAGAARRLPGSADVGQLMDVHGSGPATGGCSLCAASSPRWPFHGITFPCCCLLMQRATNGDGRPALRLVRASPEEAAAWEAEQRQKRIEAIHEAAGARDGHYCPSSFLIEAEAV